MTRSEQGPKPRKAWRVHCRRIFAEDAGIYSATSRGGAIAAALSGALDAGYCVEFTDFYALRTPQYDAWAAARIRSAGVCENFLREEIARGG